MGAKSTNQNEMKKLILAFIAVGSMATAQAQKAGSILLYGTAGINTSRTIDDVPTSIGTDNETRVSFWNYSPGIGFQFNKNWTVGAAFSYANFRVRRNANLNIDDITSQNEFVVGPFLRYTTPFSRTFFAFHQLDLNYIGGRNKTELTGTPDVIDRYNGFQASLTPAFGVNVTRCIALNFGIGGIGYRTTVLDYEDATLGEQRANNFFVSFGQQFHWGISANIGGYKHMRGHRGEPGMERRKMNAYDDDDSEEMPRKKKRMNEDDEE